MIHEQGFELPVLSRVVRRTLAMYSLRKRTACLPSGTTRSLLPFAFVHAQEPALQVAVEDGEVRELFEPHAGGVQDFEHAAVPDADQGLELGLIEDLPGFVLGQDGARQP